jgi:hypothetical protein
MTADLLDDPVTLPNDLVAVGETATRTWMRGTKKLQSQIGPMALGLAEAKRRFPALRAFGEWLKTSPYADVSRDDREALIKLGRNWTDELAARMAELPTSSPRSIWAELNPFPRPAESEEEAPDSADDADDEDDEETDDSGFYGKPRETRSNEAWDTVDERLVPALIATVPALRNAKIWEPAAGRGLMADQLRNAGAEVIALSDVAPRRADVAGEDFLAATGLPRDVDAIVTNPPWGTLAAPFVRHALALALPARAMVAMLMPLPWIAGSKIADMTGSPAFDMLVVPRFRARWMTDEEEAALEGGPQGPKMSHVWLVWDFARDPKIAAVVEFVDAPEPAEDRQSTIAEADASRRDATTD